MASFPSPPVEAAAPRPGPPLSCRRRVPGLPRLPPNRRSSLAIRPSAIADPANPLRCTRRRAVSPRLRKPAQGLGAASTSTIGSFGEERNGWLSCLHALPHLLHFGFSGSRSSLQVVHALLLEEDRPFHSFTALFTFSRTWRPGSCCFRLKLPTILCSESQFQAKKDTTAEQSSTQEQKELKQTSERTLPPSPKEDRDI